MQPRSNQRTFEKELNPEKALIFRIVHIKNLPWLLDNGLHCGNSSHRFDQWEPIGKADLIAGRASYSVKSPGIGRLNDYVPFYFTPFSPMLLNIKSGRNGVPQRPNEDIVILVSSLHKIKEQGLRFLFTDGHAYLASSNFYTDLSQLSSVDWGILQRRDFARDMDDPHKMDRYQAEALVHESVPVTALLGVVCYTEQIRNEIQHQVDQRQLELKVYSRSGWYF